MRKPKINLNKNLLVGRHGGKLFGLAIFFACLLQTTSAQAVCTGYNARYGSSLCFDDFAGLMATLQSPTNRTHFRLIRPSNGMRNAAASHMQYDHACFFFSVAPIVEYFGYSRREQFSSHEIDFYYVTNGGLQKYEDFDAGYHASPEYLMAAFTTSDSAFRGCRGMPGGVCAVDTSIYEDGFLSPDRNALNPDTRRCSRQFSLGDEYGVCQSLLDDYGQWMNRTSAGCGGDCACSSDASCGMFWFLNEPMASWGSVGGCNDARPFAPRNLADIHRASHIIKAFVDNNTPMLVAIDDNRHFVTLVGYTQFEDTGMPRFAILSDPSERGIYWLSPITHMDLNGSFTDDPRWTMTTLYPWNHHMNRACEKGGWASELDQGAPTQHRVCDGVPHDCQEPYYGITVECINKDRTTAYFHTTEENPYIVDDRGISCEKVKVLYRDGEHEVVDALAHRYRYDTLLNKWRPLATYDADFITSKRPYSGYVGPRNKITFSHVWPENYWLVASDLDGRYKQRRTSLELTLDDGSKVWVEISPPKNFELKLVCYGKGDRITRNYRTQADKEFFLDRNGVKTLFFMEDSDVRCDKVQLRVQTGDSGSEVVSAEIERQYYGAEGRWKKMNATAPWAPDKVHLIDDGLTGSSKAYLWDGSWLDANWLVADEVGAGSTAGDRRTVVRLMDSTGQVVRSVIVAAYDKRI